MSSRTSSDTSSDTTSTPPTSPLLSDFGERDWPLWRSLSSSFVREPELLDNKFELPSIFPPLPSLVAPSSVDPQDAQTPDSWIKRDPSLVRLTGKHPFNCEAKLTALFNAGFLTPTSLFYVRNHGAVPQVDSAAALAWRLRIHGLVHNEVEFSIPQLASLFPVVTLPITLVCAGNRRKEQNVVRKGLGFNWGAAGLSTALFTGVYLADILEYANPVMNQAKHVIFEGADSLPNGPYGTSQKLSWAANKEKGMLISWAMNGLPLEPDHGFPLRVVIPGQIGGRSVKWLNRIEVSNQESQHHLHFWDNKVLPTQILPEEARAEKHWWYDPKYIINDLNVNSAIAVPDHDEVLEIPRMSLSEAVNSYSIQGYAYTGGGRRVSRVEISLDQGFTWRLADITYPEDLYRAVCHSDPVFGTIDLTERDTCFCWCFWTFKVHVEKLVESCAIIVRAMDDSMNIQQADMYWNPTGMMNNWYFRVAIHKTTTDSSIMLRFEHPTMAGPNPGGWMERMKSSNIDYLRPSFGSSDTSSVVKGQLTSPPAKLSHDEKMINPSVDRKITRSELKAQDRCQPWFVVNNQVYDGTPFLNDHPGGADSIFLVAGEDATDDFMAIHSPEGIEKLSAYHIGTLVSEDALPLNSVSLHVAETLSDSAEDESVFLNKTKWKNATLIEIERLSHDSRNYRFSLGKEDQSLGLPVGQHVFVRLKRKNGEVVQRAYTPVSQQGDRGFIDFLIKIYFPSTDYPDGGRMTMGFHDLVVGDAIQIKGPLGSFIWEGKGVASWRGVKRAVKNLGLICAGSGITPILQVLRSVLQDDEDKETRLWLLDANRTQQDILCRSELDNLAQVHSANAVDGNAERFVVHYTLSKPDPLLSASQLGFSIGRINDEMLRSHLPPANAPDSLVLICGPDKLIKETVQPGLDRLGWDTANTLVIF